MLLGRLIEKILKDVQLIVIFFVAKRECYVVVLFGASIDEFLKFIIVFVGQGDVLGHVEHALCVQLLLLVIRQLSVVVKMLIRVN